MTLIYEVIFSFKISALKCETPLRFVHRKLIPATTGLETTVRRLHQGQSRLGRDKLARFEKDP